MSKIIHVKLFQSGTDDGPRGRKHICRNKKKHCKKVFIMSLGHLLHHLPTALKNSYREYEKLKKRSINAFWSMEFNGTCLNEDVLPKYTHFRSYDPAVTQTAKTLEYRRYLVQREIQNKEQEKSEAEAAAERIWKTIEEYPIDGSVKAPVNETLDSLLINHTSVTKTRTIKKLNDLTK